MNIRFSWIRKTGRLTEISHTTKDFSASAGVKDLENYILETESRIPGKVLHKIQFPSGAKARRAQIIQISA